MCWCECETVTLICVVCMCYDTYVVATSSSNTGKKKQTRLLLSRREEEAGGTSFLCGHYGVWIVSTVCSKASDAIQKGRSIIWIWSIYIGTVLDLVSLDLTDLVSFHTVQYHRTISTQSSVLYVFIGTAWPSSIFLNLTHIWLIGIWYLNGSDVSCVLSCRIRYWGSFVIGYMSYQTKLTRVVTYFHNWW